MLKSTKGQQGIQRTSNNNAANNSSSDSNKSNHTYNSKMKDSLTADSDAVDLKLALNPREHNSLNSGTRMHSCMYVSIGA